MKNNIFLEQPRRGYTREAHLTPYKAGGRSVGMITVILLVLSVLATACNKPEKEKLAGNWRWTYSSTGGCFGQSYTPESSGFGAEIVFTGGNFTLYKNGEKITSGSFQIQQEEDNSLYSKSDATYHRKFLLKLNLTGGQIKKIREETDGKIELQGWYHADIIRYDDPSKKEKLVIRGVKVGVVEGSTHMFERK